MSQEKDCFNDAELTVLADEIMQDKDVRPFTFNPKIKLTNSNSSSTFSSIAQQVSTPPPTKMAPKTPSPSKRAPAIPFNANSKYWNKAITVISTEYAKRRVKVEWKFVLNNVAHSAMLTHSQKRNASLPSSRALYVDGMRLYSNKVKDNVFTTRMNDDCLRFKIERSENEQENDYNYRYILCINHIPHSIAYKQWLQKMDGKEIKIMDVNEVKRKKSKNNQNKNGASSPFWSKANRKSSWRKKDDHLPIIPMHVPDKSFEDESDDEESGNEVDDDEYENCYENVDVF